MDMEAGKLVAMVHPVNFMKQKTSMFFLKEMFQNHLLMEEVQHIAQAVDFLVVEKVEDFQN